jgi:hypothetical protein
MKQNERIIRRHDKNLNQSQMVGTRLSEGFLFEKGVLHPSDREFLISIFDKHYVDSTNATIYYTPLMDGHFAKIVRSIMDLYLRDMKNYLGPSLRLDCYYFHATTPVSSKSVSSSWHTDNVGHRIKMFITLQSDGKVPTAYLPGSNRKLFRMPLMEQLRKFGILDHRKKKREKLIRHESGSVALVDTNGLHRGVYEASRFRRLCFVIEFIDREKANALDGRNDTVGPGRIVPSCEPTRFTDEAVAILSDVLDRSILHNMGGGIHVYDLKRPLPEGVRPDGAVIPNL